MGPLVALAGRLAATRGGAAIMRGGARVAAGASRAKRVTSARIGRAIGPKNRMRLKKFKRGAGVFGDLYMAQRYRDKGLTTGKAAKAIRKAELLRGAIGGKKYLSGKGAAQPGAIPAKKTPKTAKEVTKPSISAINEQLSALLKVVTHIRDISEDKQNTLIKNEVDAVKASEEDLLESNVGNNLEGPDAVPEAANDNDASGLGSTFDEFSQAIDSLTKTIQDLIDRQGGEEEQGGGGSFGDLFMNNFRRGKGLSGNPFSAESIVGKGQTRLSGLANTAKESMQSGKIGRAIKSGAGAAASKAARGAGATKDVIRKLARPILAKSLGKTALKSIPLIGAAAGAIFAVGKLLDGDFVGAGLEAASGLAGPATAIPAFILSVSRDIYSSVYGVNPEEDPLFSERMPELEEAVKAEAAMIMSPQVETKEGVTTSSGGQAETPGGNPQQQMQQMAQKAAAPTMAATTPPASSGPPAGSGPAAAPDAAPAASPSTSGGGGAPSGGSSGSSTSGASSSGGSTTPPPVGASSPSKGTDATNVEKAAEKVAGAETSPPQAAAPTQTDTSASSAGAKIMQATEKSEEAANKMPVLNIGSDGKRPMPQRFPTERQGFTGSGNVPNPGIDNMGTMAYQLYFGVAA